MTRYVRYYGTIRCGAEELKLAIVIRTDDVLGAEAEGFEAIDDGPTDEEIKRRYGVQVIYEVEDRSPVN